MKVAVIGAGIAGLRTAQLLEREGAEVQVFEARDRVGGRLQTVARGGGFYEAGGEWIDSDHARVLALLDEFSLKPEPTDPRPRWLRFCGEDAWSDDAWPEAAMATQALWELVPEVRSGAKRFRTLGDMLDEACKGGVARAYCEAVALSDEGTNSQGVDADAWSEFYEVYEDRSVENEEMSAFRFPGGAQRLCERMSGTLRMPVAFGRVAVGVTEDGSIRFSDGEAVDSDVCVLAVPPTCLNKIELPPIEQLWRCLQMSPTCKVVLEFSEPLWELQGWGGSLMSDLALQQAWPGGRDGLRLMTCYVNGTGAVTLAKSPDPVQECLAALETFIPGARRAFIGGSVHDWTSDPFAGGGFPVVPPGCEYRPPLIHDERVPNLHFAGDWTAQWMGFIEGALESAERVASKIVYGREFHKR